MNRKLQESLDLNGEGRIRKVGDTFTCDYYVKDHLGSTREVVSDEGAVTEATMYYPYGTMETLCFRQIPVTLKNGSLKIFHIIKMKLKK